LKYPVWQVMVVLTLLAYGCPIPAIVAAFGLDERTVWEWRQKAGEQAGPEGTPVQEAVVCTGQVDVGQVQGDEFYLKTQCGGVWVATAMSVFSRLFLWGAVSIERNTTLVTQVVIQVKAAALPERPLLWAVDGFGAWTQAILHCFRRPHYTGQPARPQLVVWPQLHIVQVVKRYTARRLSAVERRLVHGVHQAAEAIVFATQLGWGCFNTAYIERLNATFRGWLPIASRRSRTPAARRYQVEAALFWTGVVYNFCHIHASLQATPAMAAGLTDYVWSIDQLLRYRVQRE
jgi:transposase InsO family protein